MIKMNKFQKTAFIFIALGLFYTQALSAKEDKDIAIVEDEEENVIDLNIKEDEKILWPYPVHYEPKQNDTKETVVTGDSREKRFLLPHYSYPQTPIMDLMKQTLSVNYKPKNVDIFDIFRDSYPLPRGFSKPLDEYDYVIVGAGSAGSILAARLTEDKPRTTVLLLEAGEPEMLLSDIPLYAPHLSLSDYAWPYSTEPQTGVCLGSAEQRCHWPRGRAVGGSSVTDYMMYTRGRPQDWDRIAADGNYGWSYNEVLPYFMKSQKSYVKKYKQTPYSGQEGELLISSVPFRTGLVEAFLEAGRINGHPTVDYNAPDEFGFGYIQTHTFKGHRWSAAKAFLHPHKRRRNLHILPGARATKVIIEPNTKRAYAVEYVINKTKYKVRCRREIILSAGPIASAQLLMLSGIGPKEHLEHHKIPVIADLQVGRTLYDHLAFPGVIFTLDSSNASIREPKVSNLHNLIQWMTFGDSLLASPTTIEGIGYLKTDLSDDQELVPDIALISLGASIAFDNGAAFRQSWRITDHTYYTAYGNLNDRDTWSAIPVLLHPKSRGYLELRDTNPFSLPKLYSNYLTDPKDIATMIAGIRKVIKLGESQPFKKYGAQLYRAQYPGCESYAFGTDEYWECALRVVGVTNHDQTSTCKMGPPSDPEAVVDPELRVYGVEGIRVVDSGIIPRTISAHTNAPAIMIGEKAADMIKRTWANVAT